MVFIIAAVLIGSCQKDEDVTDVATVDVIFSAVDANTFKSSGTNCDNPGADYAQVVIDGEMHRPEVFHVNGKAYTRAIKMVPGEYEISSFIMFYSSNTPADSADDVMVKAAPMLNAEYAEFVEQPLAITLYRS